MKRCNLFFLIIFFVFPFEIWAQGTDNTKSDDGSLLHYSNFSASVEFTTKYMWRGIEYGTSPVFLPMLSYDYKGLNVYAMGGYATNGSHQEVDFGISYNYKWLTIGVNDYYYPTAVGEKDNYFVFKTERLVIMLRLLQQSCLKSYLFICFCLLIYSGRIRDRVVTRLFPLTWRLVTSISSREIIQ